MLLDFFGCRWEARQSQWIDYIAAANVTRGIIPGRGLGSSSVVLVTRKGH